MLLFKCEMSPTGSCAACMIGPHLVTWFGEVLETLGVESSEKMEAPSWCTFKGHLVMLLLLPPPLPPPPHASSAFLPCHHEVNKAAALY